MYQAIKNNIDDIADIVTMAIGVPALVIFAVVMCARFI